jgi:hypothetical protein
MSEPSPPDLHALLADQRRKAALGASFRAEAYCETHPALRGDAETLLDLIYNEIVLREGRGETPGLSEYVERFPDLAGPLADLFEVHRAIDAAATRAASGAASDGDATTVHRGLSNTRDLPPWATPPAAPGPPPSPRASAEPGWPVLDGYEITGLLGSGGMGVVYRARDLRRGVTVAVKTMRQADAASILRFKQEFRALRDVSHSNLVALHELISDGRSYFIVMEYVDGVTLLEHVRQGRPADDPHAPGRTAGSGTGATTEALTGVLAVDAPSLPPTTVVPPESTGTQATLLEPPGAAPRPAPPAPHAAGLGREGRVRLRRVLRQLAEGLAALHEAGKLHRDIKPSNVMVARDGRVLLMDFGLVASSSRGGSAGSSEGNVVGTAAYMAPEQAAGARVSPASDWYSVGAVLFEALTGRFPFAGGALQILMDKQRFEPPPPRELVADVPDDLNALCVDLLRRDPGARPTGREVLNRLGAATPGPAPGSSAGSHSGDLPFVGRAAHCAAILEAFEATARGRTTVVFVSGRSGVGKSALVQHVLDSLAVGSDAVVLAGRCYERESMPYKALDSLIDALSRHLRHLPAHEAGALLPRDVGPLARVFPVLRRVEAVALAPRREAETPDPQELRRKAYAALRELLARLGDRHPLVLAIDDLQWSDSDSLAVLTELLRPPDPPVLLLVAAYRSEEVADNALLRAALRAPGAAGVDCRDVIVDPLGRDEAENLALQLLGADARHVAQASTIAVESGGNPFFVAELARAVQTGTGAASGAGAEPEVVALDEVLWSRVARLPDEARRLLEVVAVSGGPLAAPVAWRCLDRSGDERATFALLRSARLVRGAAGADQVETYHDRVRETVVAHLPPDALTDCHRRLARALETSGGADAEVLGNHLLGAGEPERAAGCFARAAAAAAEALAFDRASGLYRRALDLHPAAADGRRHRVALGAALASAGRGAEAAREYLAACEGATVAEALELRRQAAMQFLISGHIDQGLETLRDVLAAVGLSLPGSPRRALISLLYHRARLRLRGTAFRPRDTSEVSAAELTRIDVCWSAGIGLSNVDWIRGADFQARGLLLALRTGEPYRVARALAVEVVQTATAGRPAHRRTARLLDTAGTLARASGEPYALGMLDLAEGVSAYLEARWADALAACDRAEGVFRDRCTGVAWELDTAHAYALWALSHLGRWAELARRFPLLINEARGRGDLYAVMNLSTYVLTLVRLAADDLAGARDEMAHVKGQWSRDGYHVQHNDLIWASVLVDLYAGDGPAAWERIGHHWPTLARSLLLRVQFIRVAMLGLRGRCALAAAGQGGVPASVVSLAASAAARLERERLPWADAQAALLRAGVAARRGRRSEAIARLRDAAARFQACGMDLCAAAAGRRLGAQLGGEEGRAAVAAADAFFARESVRQPARVTDLYVPGFDPG